MIYVLAGDERNFLAYCREHELDPRARPPMVKRITEERQLMGIILDSFDEIVITNWWWNNPNGMPYEQKDSMLRRIKILETLKKSHL